MGAKQSTTDIPSDDAALREIVEGVESETGDRFFYSLVKHLASALGCEYAFVSELLEDRSRFRTRAAWGRGSFLENFETPRGFEVLQEASASPRGTRSKPRTIFQQFGDERILAA